MKRLASIALLLNALFAAAQGAGDRLLYTLNQGQWPDHVLAQAPVSRDARVFVEENGLTYHLWAEEDLEALHAHHSGERPESVRSHVVRLKWAGVSSEPKIISREISSWRQNFFLGKDPSRWATNVEAAGEVKLTWENGRTHRYHSSGNVFKYDMILPPATDRPSVVAEISGAEEIRVSSGLLEIRTSVGTLRETVPLVYQEINGHRREVSASWELIAPGRVGLRLGDYDLSQPLVIDPVVVFSTYSKSAADNFGYSATYDDSGHVYGGGIAFGIGYPTATGAQMTFAGGAFDVAITKFTPDGVGQVFSTYLGGSGNEQPHSMVVAPNGELVVFGATSSANFPVTPTAYDTTFNGGTPTTPEFLTFNPGSDIFITRFSPSGSALSGSTFLGGSGNDGLNEMVNYNYGDASRGEVIIGPGGEVLIASATSSADFPVTAGAAQTLYGGSQDGVITSFNSTLTQRNWATFWGGANAEALNSLCANANGVYAAGYTESPGLPAGPGVYETAHSGGRDGTVIQVSLADGAWLRATYNGTSSTDANFLITSDYDGDVYLFGQSKGVYGTNAALWGVSNSTQFVQKLTPTLSSTSYVTEFGNGSKASFNLAPTALMVDQCKNVYLSGWGGLVNYEGSTFGLPITPDAYKSSTDGSDFYFLVLDATWDHLIYATFFGGAGAEHVDGGTSRFSPEGLIYQGVCAGCGGNSNFPAFPPNVWSTTNASTNCNMAVMKIDFETDEVVAAAALVEDSSCVPFTAQFVNTSFNADSYWWDFGNGNTGTGPSPQPVYTLPGTYQITLVAIDSGCGLVDTTTLELSLYDPDLDAQMVLAHDPCNGSLLLTYQALSGNGSVFWDFGDGNTSTTVSGTHLYASEGDYVVVLTRADSLCGVTDSTSGLISFHTQSSNADFVVEYEPCLDPFRVDLVYTGSGYDQQFWDFGDGTQGTGNPVNHVFSAPGKYVLQMTVTDTLCGTSEVVEKEVIVSDGSGAGIEVPNVFTPNGDGSNDQFRPIGINPYSTYGKYHLKVFNRWGTEIFVSSEPEAGWNGDWDRSPLPEGVYFWVLRFENACGTAYQNEGFVHLMR